MRKGVPPAASAVSGRSDKVLKDMNRRYTKAEYLEKIAAVKQRIPGIALSSDVIVGSRQRPTRILKKRWTCCAGRSLTAFFRSFIPDGRGRGGKACACAFGEEIHRNFERLLEVQNEISKKKNDAYVGRVERVLVDGPSKTDPSVLSGRTTTGKIVNFKGGAELTGPVYGCADHAGAYLELERGTGRASIIL